MVSTTIYLIDSTDGSTTFAIQPRTFDGVGGVQQHTDVTLYGNATPNWGERFNENYYRMLENFAVEQMPLPTLLPIPQDQVYLGITGRGINHPIQGQQWFNKTDNKLYVYTGSNWKSITSVTSGVTVPSSPVTGDLWYNTLVNQLMVYDGTVWKATEGNPADFVGIVGDTMTGLLTLSADPTNALHAATKQYVDDTVSSAPYVEIDGSTPMTGELTLSSSTPSTASTAASKGYVDTAIAGAIVSTYVEIDGSTPMTGNLTLANSTPTNVLHAASKGYVDSIVNGGTFVDSTGDVMTGFLTLNADPTAALHAATKQYVDASGGVTVGAVIPFPTNTLPTGYLRCNGAAISRTVYADLFAAVGTTYGIGDGSTTFNLPDLRGEFIRGFDDGRGVDVGRLIGSAQADELKSHTHASSAFSSNSDELLATGGVTAANNGTSTGSTGGTETRPRNIAMLYCIKY